MFRTLMVPLDGSEQSEQALPYAVRLALASGARLALVRAALGPPPSGFDWERQQLAAVSEAESYLAEVADKVITRVPVVTSTIYGNPAAKLLDAVEELRADAIVMATHARTGLDHFLHGSVAEAVLAKSPVPVFLVHGRSDDAPRPPFDPISARIVVPLDGSPFSEAAVPVACQLLGVAGELVLVSVAAAPDHVERDERGRPRAFLDQQEEALKRDVFDYLRNVAARLRDTDPDLHVTIDVRVGDPAPGIVMAETDRGADLVVMSTHGRTGLGRAVMGSVAGEVLRTGSAPVVLVGPASARVVAQPAHASNVSS
jgi:nucleotide-binding universal stress UspA family protein